MAHSLHLLVLLVPLLHKGCVGPPLAAASAQQIERVRPQALAEHTFYWTPARMFPPLSKPNEKGTALLSVTVGEHMVFECDGNFPHRIYRVGRRGFDECTLAYGHEWEGSCEELRIGGPDANKVFPSLRLTIRELEALPGQAAFRPYNDYFYISPSTGTRDGMNQTSGGLCEEFGMKLWIRVLPKGRDANVTINEAASPFLNTTHVMDFRPYLSRPPKDIPASYKKYTYRVLPDGTKVVREEFLTIFHHMPLLWMGDLKKIQTDLIKHRRSLLNSLDGHLESQKLSKQLERVNRELEVMSLIGAPFVSGDPNSASTPLLLLIIVVLICCVIDW